MKTIIITSIIVFSFIDFLASQNPADLYYQLLDKEYREITSKNSPDYLIREFEEYLNSYPNSAQEDEILYRLSILYESKNEKIKQFFSLLKLNLLHAKSPLQKKVSQIIDSLVTYNVEMRLTEKSEQALKTLNNRTAKSDYRLAYVDFLSFLHSAEISVIDQLAIKACNTYKMLFKTTLDMDAVIFWQGDIYKRNKNYDQAMLNYKAVRLLFSKSQYVPSALFELAQLSIDYKQQPDNATDYYIELINQYPEAAIAGDAQYELALLYDKYFKDMDEALTNYKLHVQAFPDNHYYEYSLKRIAELYALSENYGEALNYYKKIVESTGNNDFIVSALLKIYEINYTYLKDKVQAANAFLLLAQMFPAKKETPGYLLKAAKIYLNEIKDSSKAAEILNIIAQQYPKSKEAQEAKSLNNN